MKVAYTGTRLPNADSVEVVHLPMLQRVGLALPPDIAATLRGAGHTRRFAVFYSRNAAEVVLETLDPADFANVEVWAVGEKTAAWLSDRLQTEVSSPERQDFEGLVEALRATTDSASFILSFELEGSPRRLQDVGLDAVVASVAAYETVRCDWDDLDGVLRREAPSWVVFASPRAFDAFMGNLHHRIFGDSYRVAAIGPTTRDAIIARGERVDFMPRLPDLDLLLRELAQQ